jgi:cellulose synthase/poly-beta-1,6-N-acetylglucosamine synthase-like glycosyltransferase
MSWRDMVATPVAWFMGFVLVYFVVLHTRSLLRLLFSEGTLRRAARGTFVSDELQIMHSEMTWPISIILTAHNKEESIVAAIRSLLMVHYGEFEIVVVNDGSTDHTLERLVRAYDLAQVDKVYKRSIATQDVRAVYGSLLHRRITVVDKIAGGKADALNTGINVSRYPLFCALDADATIEDDALVRALRPFMEHPEQTVAATGTVHVLNGCELRDGRVTRFELPPQLLPTLQAVEYLRAFLSGRGPRCALQSLSLISGAFGLYSKQEVVDVGGYDPGSGTADIDLVIRLQRDRRDQRRRRVVLLPDPVCWIKVPTKLGALWRQRDRWHRGLMRALWINRDILGNPRFGSLGLVDLPQTLLFELLGPFIETAGFIVVFVSFLLGILGAEWLLLFLAATVLYGVFLSVTAVLLEENAYPRCQGWVELSKLIVCGIVENLGYRQMLSLFKVKATWDALRNRGTDDPAKRVTFSDSGTRAAEPAGGR